MFVMTLVMVLFFASCNDDPEEVEHYIIIESNNGENLKVRNDTLCFLQNNQFPVISTKPVDPNRIETLHRYIDIMYKNEWVKTYLGDWCIDYGLSPDSIYLARKEYYFQIIPNKDGYIAIPFVPTNTAMALYERADKGECIGYHGGVDITPIEGKTGNCWTYVYHIGYDYNGNYIGLYIPVNPNELEWYYSWYKIN